MQIHSTASIHQSAIIENSAQIGANCKIGPFCYVGKGVKIFDNVNLISHVSIFGNTKIGESTKIWPFASVGHDPQDLKFAGEKTKLVIGKNNKIRESVSINSGTEGGGGITRIGDNCLFMLGSHVAHDCQIGNNVVVANNGSIGGHVVIEDNVTIGGLSGVHQFCRIGESAMIGAVSMVSKDVIPYGLVMGERSSLTGVNVIGLKRRGFSNKQILELQKGFKFLFYGDGSLRDRAENIMKTECGDLVAQLVSFILSDSSRKLTTPQMKHNQS